MKIKDIKKKILSPSVIAWTKEHRKYLILAGIFIVLTFILWRCDVNRYYEKIAGVFNSSGQKVIDAESERMKQEAAQFDEKKKAADEEKAIIEEAKSRADSGLKKIKAKKLQVKKELASAEKNKSLETLAADFKRLGFTMHICNR